MYARLHPFSRSGARHLAVIDVGLRRLRAVCRLAMLAGNSSAWSMESSLMVPELHRGFGGGKELEDQT